MRSLPLFRWLAAPWVLAALLSSVDAAGTPAGTVITNTAVFDSQDGAVSSNPVSITVQPVCALELQPPHLEQSLQAGVTAVFAHTLLNLGNSTQQFALVSAPDGTRVSLDRNRDGRPGDDEAVQSVTLEPDGQAPLLLSGTAAAGSARWTLTASCANGGATASASDTLTGAARALELTKVVTSDQVTLAGAVVSYQLRVHNPNRLAATDVTVSDALPAGETFTAATPAPDRRDGRSLSWTFARLEPDETRVIDLQVTLDQAVPDDTLIVNTAEAVTSSLPGRASSSAAVRVFTTRLLVQKGVRERSADVGDLLHYTVTVSNPSAVTLREAFVDDTPAAGLRYRPGSAGLDGQPLADPEVRGSGLRFNLGTLLPRSVRVLTYVLQVTPAAGERLDNVAEAHAIGSNGAVIAEVDSNLSNAAVQRQARLFGGQAEILGRVYVDRSHSGYYVEGRDTPVAGARILLAGGQEVLTDLEGRYHFAGLTPGLYALRLDPKSTPWAALPWQGDQGLTGSRQTDVWGLTNVDFPLAPNTGSIQ